MRRILLLAGIVGGAIPVFAQAPLPVFDDSVVVTASVAAENQDELPATVTVVGAQEIETRQATAVADLLATVPGVSLTRSGSPGHATSLFSRGTESNHTLVLWNGVPLNDPFLGGFDWAFLPTEGVERVEIVRGPWSALYGSNALGGVVQVLSGSRPGVGLRLEGGDRGYERGALAAGTKLGEVQFDLTGHLRRGDGEQPNDFYDSDEAAARATWNLREATTLGLLLRAQNSDIGIPRSGDELTPHRRQGFQERQVALPFHATQASWDVEALLSQATATLRFRDPDAVFSSSDTDTEDRRARATTTHRFGDGVTLAGGGEWERQKVTNATNFGGNLDDATRENSAAFAQLHAAAGRASVDLGVRRDRNQFYGQHTSPKVGAVLRLGEHSSLHASYGEGFRAPSFLELFYPFSGNPALRPEVSRSGELGWSYAPAGWILRATAFENRLRDLIDFDPVTFQDFNVARARTRGVEGEVAWQHNVWSVRWNGTYLDAKNLTTGAQLLRRPRTSSNLLFAWTPARWRWSAVVRQVGERRDFPDLRLPGYVTADFGAAWKWNERLEPYARLENLLDRRYAEAAGYPAPRRRVTVGLALRL